ncbi:MAG: HAMP domain-containing sensor histidine kinase [Alsobacter sp.]
MGLVAVLAVLVATGFLYARFSATNGMFREGTLRSFAQRIADDIREGGGGPNLTNLRSADLIQAAGGAYAIVSRGGQLLSHSQGQAEPLAAAQAATESFFTIPKGGSGDTLFGYSSRIDVGGEPLLVQVAFPAGHVLFDSILEEFVEDIAWIWLPFVVGILVTALVVGRIALRPLSLAANQAEMIGPGSVAHRLPEGSMPRDVLALVQAVNRSLDRLQGGYEALEEFVGDVAHELRTPLAVMKAHLGTSDFPRAPMLGEDVAAMERIIEQLLDRVRLGGLHLETGDRIDLVDVAREAASMVAVGALARDRRLELVETGPIWIPGKRDFLVRAVRNLLDNAMSFAPRGSTIVITVGPDAVLEVRDSGPGFPERFLDPASRGKLAVRSDRRGGVGLGLSIVERTMIAHGGSLQLSNAPAGGAIARMVFAAHAAPPDHPARASKRPQSLHQPLDAL